MGDAKGLGNATQRQVLDGVELNRRLRRLERRLAQIAVMVGWGVARLAQ